ncbi:regulatory protein GemA [Ramlibacter sp. H39-3-26]|uniref:regulatory protein GemA n=1 Tax=Curvibacter soli TaxID=3031331 RepID=UPI0023D9B74D|nr:regulatory protein GemA [Ramlibacter sp. H39-3-26]MDF1486688.1 regulatory protein GemA [Ramlibacter sp. H39-3-26]
MTANHVAAIHVLKSKLRLSDDDYRALLNGLTGKTSSLDLTAAERQGVRDHMQRLAERAGIATATRRRPLTQEQFDAVRKKASPRERKVWALWHQLHRDGLVNNPSRAALDAWVERTVHVTALRFCTTAQLDTCIEALKAWQTRGDHHA